MVREQSGYGLQLHEAYIFLIKNSDSIKILMKDDNGTVIIEQSGDRAALIKKICKEAMLLKVN